MVRTTTIPAQELRDDISEVLRRVEAGEPGAGVLVAGDTARAALRSSVREAGRRTPVDDSWITATALALDVAVATQDGDFDAVPGLRVIRL